MPRRPTPVTRTTLYRLDHVPELSDAIRDKYLDGDAFTAAPTTVGDREALLVYGSMTTERVAWATTVHAVTSLQVVLGNVTAASALIIRTGDDEAWPLTYGMASNCSPGARSMGGGALAGRASAQIRLSPTLSPRTSLGAATYPAEAGVSTG